MPNAPRPAVGADVCAVQCIHANVIQAVAARMPGAADIGRLAAFYKLFGDGTRIAILWALNAAELCVCDLCALLSMKQPAVSHQLSTLKQAHIVKSRRDGKVVYYSLDDEHIHKVLSFGMDHLHEL